MLFFASLSLALSLTLSTYTHTHRAAGAKGGRIHALLSSPSVTIQNSRAHADHGPNREGGIQEFGGVCVRVCACLRGVVFFSLCVCICAGGIYFDSLSLSLSLVLLLSSLSVCTHTHTCECVCAGGPSIDFTALVAAISELCEPWPH
jgi:hypothetical protein